MIFDQPAHKVTPAQPPASVDEQSDWLDTLAAAGVDVVVTRPGNYDETIETLTTGVRTE